MNAVVQRGLIALHGQDVVRFVGDDVMGHLCLTAHRVEPIVRRNASAQIQKRRQPFLLRASPSGGGHEVVRSTDDRTHRNRHHVDQRIDHLSPPWVRQLREMILDRHTHTLGVLGMRLVLQHDHDSIAQPLAEPTPQIAPPQSSQLAQNRAIALPLPPIASTAIYCFNTAINTQYTNRLINRTTKLINNTKALMPQLAGCLEHKKRSMYVPVMAKYNKCTIETMATSSGINFSHWPGAAADSKAS